MNRGRGLDPFDPVYGLPHGGVPSDQPIVQYQPPPPQPVAGLLSNDWESDDITKAVGDIPVTSAASPAELQLFTTVRPHQGIDVHVSNTPLQATTGAYQIRVYAIQGRNRSLVDTWASQGNEGPQLACATRGGPVRWEVSVARSGNPAGIAPFTDPVLFSFVAGDLPTAPQGIGIKRASVTNAGGFGATTSLDISAAGVNLANLIVPRSVIAVQLTNTSNAQVFAHLFDDAAANTGLRVLFSVPPNDTRLFALPFGQITPPGAQAHQSFVNGVRLTGSSSATGIVALAANTLIATVWLK